jgi:hypothetical protein
MMVELQRWECRRKNRHTGETGSAESAQRWSK